MRMSRNEVDYLHLMMIGRRRTMIDVMKKKKNANAFKAVHTITLVYRWRYNASSQGYDDTH